MDEKGKPGEERLDALLARGRMSGPARDRALEGALAAAGVGAPRRRWRWVFGLAPAVAAAALAVILLRPARPEFQARGGAGAVLEVGCREGRCAAGGTILFQIDGAAEGGFLEAWAVRAGDPAGERVWYFPGAEGSAAVVPARVERQVLGRGAVVGAGQPPGKWEVHLVLSRRALSREEALSPPAAEVIASATVPLEVLP